MRCLRTHNENHGLNLIPIHHEITSRRSFVFMVPRIQAFIARDPCEK